MTFIVIVVCLAVQWFLQLDSAAYQWHWSQKYFAWMHHRMEVLTKGHALFTVALLVLPVVIAMSVLFTLVYHLFGYVGYLVLSFGLLWYCIDVTSLKKISNSHTLDTVDLFCQSYHKIFTLLFWYFVFGPIGLVLYVVSATLHKEWIDQKYFIVLLGILDWVPSRLLGLSFALAGDFGVVFKEWLKLLPQGIADNRTVITVCGTAAMSTETKTADDAMALIQRTILVWLVVMALITVGRWIG